MEYSQLKYRYLKRGLEEFNLKSIEDFEDVFSLEVKFIRGFNELSEDNKQLFKSFLINYLNRVGLNTKAGFVPLSIHYVEEINLVGKEQESDEYYTEYSRQFYILRPDGKKEKMKRKGYHDKDIMYPLTKEYKNKFLRFDFLENKDKIWLHVISPTKWY
jgi:hypothetical protein